MYRNCREDMITAGTEFVAPSMMKEAGKGGGEDFYLSAENNLEGPYAKQGLCQPLPTRNGVDN